MDILQSATHILKDCMGLKKGESVLIITDNGMSDSIPDSLFHAAINAGCDSLIIKMKSRSVDGEEPPAYVASAMLEFDVIIAPTSKSLSHTQARLNASKRGCRIATLPGITEYIMTSGGITADYNEISRSAQKIKNLLKSVKTIRIVSDRGTDILFNVNSEKWQADTGICRDKGCFTNLPGGEIFLAPDNANGIYFIDGSIGDLGLLDSPIKVQVNNREAVSIEGQNTGPLIAMLDKIGKKGRNIAELGIGLNQNASLLGNVLEDEKVKGTAHIAFGDNSTFGGDVKAGIHIDGIMRDVTIFADGRRLDLMNFEIQN
jgi:leucyl aminopeptidase (aminopeptidase T)